MDSVLDLFLGDPVYDENKRVVRRNFGLKNAVAICLTFYALYYFLPKTTILSGMIPKGSKKKGSKKKIKMKGGDDDTLSVWGKIWETFATVMAACFIGGGGSFLLNLLFCGDHEPGGMCALGIFFMIILICFVLWKSVKFGKNIWSPPPSK
jgi:hypothetical protein